ncbi:glycosyltransferase [uncultured Lamprocystis sp.]|jgi:rhamnosyltransferase|uniref:glycosyltransferase family 2 protein n=1 Tax=uncultured Lamprocystis sp. TaxID=543132 RepID=UPI0025FF4ACE|nr:glycosyltransferase [uncultured Lamprocystis sp.]
MENRIDRPGQSGFKPKVAIVMRSYNDRHVIRGTLEMIRRQTYRNFELWNFDSTSTDGTFDIIREFNDAQHIRRNDSTSYNPGTVLNEAVCSVAMEVEIVVFINSDATPEGADWLEKLVAPLVDPKVGAVYGRQTARPDCRSLFVKDTERAFGDGREAATWIHFFSMANCAVRRAVLERFPFETRIQYSEDIEWSYRLRKAGLEIRYVAEAAATHSHNYTLRQSFKRQFGEGKADAWIFHDGEINTSFLRYCLLPFGMDVLRDLRWAAQQGSIDAVFHTVPLRAVQKWGRWRGLLAGRKAYAVH